MPFGHIHGSPNVIVTHAKPSRLYAVDGVTLKQLVQGLYNYGSVYNFVPADGDRFQIFFYARGSERYMDISTHRGDSRAIWDLWINGVLDSSGYDDYGANLTNIRHITLTQPIVNGYNLVELRINGKNVLSTSYTVGIIGASIS